MKSGPSGEERTTSLSLAIQPQDQLSPEPQSERRRSGVRTIQGEFEEAGTGSTSGVPADAKAGVWLTDAELALAVVAVGSYGGDAFELQERVYLKLKESRDRLHKTLGIV